MGLPWIAVQKSVVDHPKVIELGETLGEPLALAYLVTLWCRVAEYAPSGRVSGARPRTVLERFANWRGEPGKFAEAAISAGLVDERDGALVVHDWDELQGPHIERAKQDVDRKRKYRANLKKSQRPQTVRGRSADGPAERDETIRGTAHVEERRGEKKRVEEEDQKSLSTSSTGGALAAAAAPQPKPKPPPTPQLQLVPPEAQKPKQPSDVEVVFEAWKTTMGHPKAQLDAKRERAVKARLKDGYSVDDLKQAIKGCSLTPHNMGQNERGERYDGLELICRDTEHVDRFMANATSPPFPKARPVNPDLIVGRSTAPPPPPPPPEPDFGF